MQAFDTDTIILCTIIGKGGKGGGGGGGDNIVPSYRKYKQSSL